MWNKCSAVVESLAQDAFDPIFVESTSLGIWSLSRERASPPCMQCSNPCTLDGHYHPWSKIDCDTIFGLSWFRSSSRALQTMTMVQSHTMLRNGAGAPRCQPFHLKHDFLGRSIRC